MAEKDKTYAWWWWLMWVFEFLAFSLFFVALLNNHHAGAYIGLTAAVVLAIIFIFLNVFLNVYA